MIEIFEAIIIICFKDQNKFETKVIFIGKKAIPLFAHSPCVNPLHKLRGKNFCCIHSRGKYFP